MASAQIIVNDDNIHTPGNVASGGPIRKDEFLVEFNVKVDEPGCYAIFPGLYSYTRLPVPDDHIGYVGGADVMCYCFKKGEQKTFYVTALGDAPKNKKALAPKNSEAIKLEDIEGHWPKADFPFDNLELYVTIDVVICNLGECDNECKPFATKKYKNTLKVGHYQSPLQDDAKINGGKSAKETVQDLAKTGANASTSLIPTK